MPSGIAGADAESAKATWLERHRVSTSSSDSISLCFRRSRPQRSARVTGKPVLATQSRQSERAHRMSARPATNSSRLKGAGVREDPHVGRTGLRGSGE